MAKVSPERLKRFFVKVGDSYQIGKQVRDRCVFARHDLGKDPPFSKLDLISCRNVLIYMSTALQERVLSFFHYALKPGRLSFAGKIGDARFLRSSFCPAGEQVEDLFAESGGGRGQTRRWRPPTMKERRRAPPQRS